MTSGTQVSALPRRPFSPFVPLPRCGSATGKSPVTDGPFRETKECLAGFYLIEDADMNAGIQIASQIPPAQVGSIEVRPVRELRSTSGAQRQLKLKSACPFARLLELIVNSGRLTVSERKTVQMPT